MAMRVLTHKIIARSERKTDPCINMRDRELARRARALEQLQRHRRVVAGVGKT